MWLIARTLYQVLDSLKLILFFGSYHSHSKKVSGIAAFCAQDTSLLIIGIYFRLRNATRVMQTPNFLCILRTELICTQRDQNILNYSSNITCFLLLLLSFFHFFPVFLFSIFFLAGFIPLLMISSHFFSFIMICWVFS